MDPNEIPCEFSIVGQRLTARSGILSLMDDLGRSVTTEPDMRMLGGGNPAAVPAMQALIRERVREMLDDGAAIDGMIGNYDPPQGNPRFVAALAKLLRRTYGWDIGPENLAVTVGGQTAFFYLFNLLAGEFENGQRKKILLPLAPEYIGYADQGLSEGMFVSCKPMITWPDGESSRVFKYRINFAAVEAALNKYPVGAIAASRPTNPTGNVLNDEEVHRLAELARAYGVPLILDNAYGTPFPGVMFVPAEPYWAPHTILTLSLSKLGLPGTRTAVVIGPPRVAHAISAMTAIAGLANVNVGQQIVLPWVESGRILEIGRQILRPFYEEKSQQALGWMREACDAAGLEWAVHASEGAFFHWLWLRGLRVPSIDLYERLKARKVLVVPGEYFFFGLEHQWQHAHECLRINYSRPAETVREALQIIASEAAKCR